MHTQPQQSHQPLTLSTSELKQTTQSIQNPHFHHSRSIPKQCVPLALSHISIPKKNVHDTRPQERMVLKMLQSMHNMPSGLVRHGKEALMIGLIHMLRVLIKRDSRPVMIMDKLYIGKTPLRVVTT